MKLGTALEFPNSKILVDTQETGLGKGREGPFRGCDWRLTGITVGI